MIKILVDGYNLLHQSPVMQTGSGPIWLHQQRMRLISAIADGLASDLRSSTMIIFDAKTPPSEHTTDFEWNQIQIRFAHQHAEADDLIEKLIAEHPQPSSLTVVSSDKRIAKAARRRKSKCIPSRTWWDQFIEQPPRKTTLPQRPSDDKASKPIPELNSTQAWIDELNLSSLDDVPHEAAPSTQSIFPEDYLRQVAQEFSEGREPSGKPVSGNRSTNPSQKPRQDQ